MTDFSDVSDKRLLKILESGWGKVDSQSIHLIDTSDEFDRDLVREVLDRELLD